MNVRANNLRTFGIRSGEVQRPRTRTRTRSCLSVRSDLSVRRGFSQSAKAEIIIKARTARGATRPSAAIRGAVSAAALLLRFRYAAMTSGGAA